MKRALLVVALSCAGAVFALADTVVNTSLSLTSMTITSSTGTPTLVSTLVDPINGGVNSSAFAFVSNSLGEADPEFGSNVDGPASASSIVTWATAMDAADGSALTASAVSSVDLPADAVASAGTETACCNGQIQGLFEIMDSTGMDNPVNVTFSAAIAADQSASTDNTGVSANSEVIFNFQVNANDTNGNFLGTLLFYDNPIALTGPNQAGANMASPMLSATAALLTNTEYPFFIEADSESFAIESTPEPAPLILLIGAALPVSVLLRRRFRLS